MTELVTAPAETSPKVVAFLDKATRLYRTGDVDLITEELTTADCCFIDHRPLGGDPIIGHEAIKLWTRTSFEMLPDFQIAVKVLADRGDVYLARDTYAGTAAIGGPAMMEWFVVDTMRGGKLAREEIFADEASARAAFEATALV